MSDLEAEARKQDEAPPRLRPHILIADDEQDALTLIGLALGEKDYSLSLVRDGCEAVAACERSMPDLAILDVQMPGKTGLEVCRWLKDKSENNFIPVILLTCQSELEQKVTGLNGGADDYVTKPFSFIELAARVRSLLRIKQLTEQLSKTRDLLADRERTLVATQVAGAAAHELGQPLTSILLNCELLAKSPPQSKEFTGSLDQIARECRRVKEILDGLKHLDTYQILPYVDALQIVDLKRTDRG